jgi:hypothetical protein
VWRASSTRRYGSACGDTRNMPTRAASSAASSIGCSSPQTLPRVGSSKRRLPVRLRLEAQLYNEVRPHRGIGRKTPASVYAAREKVGPSPSFVKVGDRRLRFDRVDRAGRVTLRHRGRLHHIGIGNAYAGWRVAMLIDGLKIEIVGLDGSPLRRLVFDPTKDYRRIP